MSGTRSYWQRLSDRDRSYDVLIVGAGITGACAAYWLRRLRPELRVGVLERHDVAAGASGRNAGFLLRGSARNFVDAVRSYGKKTALEVFRLTSESIGGLRTALEAEGLAVEPTGSVLAAADDVEQGELRESVELLTHAGEAVAFWPAGVLHDRLQCAGFSGALHDPEGALLDPVLAVRRLLSSSGANVHTQCTVEAFESSATGFHVETSDGTFTGNALILALNAYAPQLCPELQSFVAPVRAQMAGYRIGNGYRVQIPVYSHQGYFYARSAADGTMMVGGGRHHHRDTEVGFADEATPALQEDLRSYVEAHFPKAEIVEVLPAWSGVMGFSPDGLPFACRTSTGALWAGGFTGHGMAFGYAVGRLLANLALGEDPGPDGELLASTRSSVMHRSTH